MSTISNKAARRFRSREYYLNPRPSEALKVARELIEEVQSLEREIEELRKKADETQPPQ